MFLLTPWDLTCEPLFTRPLQTISYKSWRVWASLLFPPFLLCLWIILLSRAHKTCFHRGGEGSCGSLEYQDSLRQRFRMESHYNPHRGAGIICAVCLWTHWWPGAYCRTHCLWHLGPERDGSGPIRSPLCHVPSDDHWQDFHDPNTDASPLSRPDDQLACPLTLIHISGGSVFWFRFVSSEYTSVPRPIIHGYHHFPCLHSFFPSWWSRHKCRGGMSSFLWSWGPLRGGPTRLEWQSPAEIKKTGCPVPTVMFPAPRSLSLWTSQPAHPHQTWTLLLACDSNQASCNRGATGVKDHVGFESPFRVGRDQPQINRGTGSMLD